MDIIRWPILKADWLYYLQPKWRSSIQPAKTWPGVDCGSDHELLIAKFRLKWKEVGKTTRPFRYAAAATATAAKSLQLCPTLCNPRDGSPPGSPIPGILQERTLEWVAISFSIAGKWKVKVKSLSHVRLLATPWTAAYQAPLSMGFARQEYWSGLSLSSPFRYDLNQIPYDYTVEVTNRFKGLDLIECLKNYGWRFVTLYRRQAVIKTIPKKNKCKKAKWLSKEALQIAEKRREAKGKGEKERYTHLNAEFQRLARREKKPFFINQCKEIEENNRMGKTRDLFKKIRDTKGTFHAKMGSIKGRNGMDLTEA